jgi:hypothetical protein
MAEPGSARGVPRRPDWAARFLEVFAATGNVRLAASAVGVSRDAPYKRARRSPAFAARWERAREDAIDTLEAEARRRALSGSDALLMFLLRAHRPERYRETLRIDIRAEAQRLASELGIDPEAAIAEAERLVAGAGR